MYDGGCMQSFHTGEDCIVMDIPEERCTVHHWRP